MSTARDALWNVSKRDRGSVPAAANHLGPVMLCAYTCKSLDHRPPKSFRWVQTHSPHCTIHHSFHLSPLDSPLERIFDFISQLYHGNFEDVQGNAHRLHLRGCCFCSICKRFFRRRLPIGGPWMCGDFVMEPGVKVQSCVECVTRSRCCDQGVGKTTLAWNKSSA